MGKYTGEARQAGKAREGTREGWGKGGNCKAEEGRQSSNKKATRNCRKVQGRSPPPRHG